MKSRCDFPVRGIMGILFLAVLATVCLYPAPDKMIRSGRSKADLDVSVVDITPFPPRAGKDLVTIKVTVVNRGDRANRLPCSLSMSIYSVDASGNRVEGDLILNAISPYAHNIPVLEPGKMCLISKAVSSLKYSGRHCVSGVINTEGLDPGEEIPTNNEYRVYFNVIEPPLPADLVLEAIQSTPEGRIKLLFRNTGNAIPDADFDSSTIHVAINSRGYRICPLKMIDPQGLLKIGSTGRQTPLSYIWPDEGYYKIQLQPGQSMQFQVTLDFNNRILDANRSNNKRANILYRLPN